MQILSFFHNLAILFSSNLASNHTRDEQIGLSLRGRQILLSLVTKEEGSLKRNKILAASCIVEELMPSMVTNVARLQWLFDIRLSGTQIFRFFKVHDLITCKSKVQVVVHLGSW